MCMFTGVVDRLTVRLQDGGGNGGGGGLDGDIARLGDRLTASSLAPAAAAFGDDSYRSPPTRFRLAREENGGGGGSGAGDRRVHANKASDFCSDEGGASPARVGRDDNDHCGLGEAGDGAEEEDGEKGETAGMEGMDTQVR